MVLKNHIGIILLLIIGMNSIECFQDDKYNNKHCDKWWTPTGVAFLFFATGEVIGWIVYFFFIV